MIWLFKALGVCRAGGKVIHRRHVVVPDLADFGSAGGATGCSVALQKGERTGQGRGGPQNSD
ncbi:hypothetical protein ACFRFU_35360 [Streptomyces sp. NPDC056704]|uniref:hypothetical protein n=1 Tax=Streptomyces sp. NPDC056704 TaxID=3345917 RepID=UPI0036B78417